MINKDNKDAENLSNNKEQLYKAENYKEIIKKYEELNLDVTDTENASDFNKWGDAILGQLSISGEMHFTN